MGTYLSTPVLDKCWEEGEDLDNSTPVAWGVVDMQGWRKSMEDAHIVQTDVELPRDKGGSKTSSNQRIDDNAQVFAVFDGHGGAEVARFCQLYLVDVLKRQQGWNLNGNNSVSADVDVGKALVNAFHAMDDLLRDPSRLDEINTLRTLKPNYAERRLVNELSTEEEEKENDNNEEKKMEETSSGVSEDVSGTAEASLTENNSAIIDESVASDDVAPTVHETISTDTNDFHARINDDDHASAVDSCENAEQDDTIDITSTDNVSLFTRLLSISNKAGATSGTVTIPLPATASNRNYNDENKVITPTIMQNGRPICNLPDHPVHAGCTSVCAVITGRTLTVANAGDSRVVLCRADGVTEPMSFDHKPMHEGEMKRIKEAGGFVNQFGRVNGNLNLSRSIGDLKYKQVPNISAAAQMITAEPDIKTIELNDDDEFIILACDGIWDCLTNEEAVKFVRERLDKCTPTEIGVEMLDKIVSKDPRETQGIGGDNMTVMIVDLLPHKRDYRKGVSATGE